MTYIQKTTASVSVSYGSTDQGVNILGSTSALEFNWQLTPQRSPSKVSSSSNVHFYDAVRGLESVAESYEK